MQHISNFHIFPGLSHVSSGASIIRPPTWSARRVEPDRHHHRDLRSLKHGGWWRIRLRALYELQRLLVERRRSGTGHNARRRHLSLPVHVKGDACHHSLALGASLGRVPLVLFQNLVDLLLPRRQRVHAGGGVLPSLLRCHRGWGRRWRFLLHGLGHLLFGLRQHRNVGRRLLDLFFDLLLWLLLWGFWHDRLQLDH